MNTLAFLNHSSFLLETDNAILVLDPWLQGSAFDGGWALLDRSTSNEQLYEFLRRKGKSVYLWYSHEHSDHFAVPFVKGLRQAGLGDVTVLYQKTIDQRVPTFLRKLGLRVVECRTGRRQSLGGDDYIVVYPYKTSGDSFCLIRASGKYILNLNDCPADNEGECRYVTKSLAPHTTNIDFLFTQFGYASWLGNESERELRQKMAAFKIEVIRKQIESLRPKVVVPFASFIYFCRRQNAYLNRDQNTAEAVLKAEELRPYRDQICFMKPWDTLDLALEAPSEQMNQEAAAHWTKLAQSPLPLDETAGGCDLATIEKEFRSFSRKLTVNFALANCVFEKLGIIKPVIVKISDLDTCVRLSYVRGFAPLTTRDFDFECSSASLRFVLANDYGFDTLHVNGLFRCSSDASYQKMLRFFVPQALRRKGFGILSPRQSLPLFVRGTTKLARRTWAKSVRLGGQVDQPGR